MENSRSVWNIASTYGKYSPKRSLLMLNMYFVTHVQLGFQYLHRWRLRDQFVPVFDHPHNKHSWTMDIHSEILFERTQEWLSMLLKSHMKD